MEKEAGVFIYLLIIGLIIIVCLFFYYFIYLNIPGEPKTASSIISELPKNSSVTEDAVQFFPNMKFNHNNISYSIESSCEENKAIRMRNAFNMINNLTGIEFIEIGADNYADIDVLCSSDTKESFDSDFFVAGEGGAKEVIQTERYNLIIKGLILLYEDRKNSVKCEWPNVEIHELMHVFGFNHTSNENSLMYPLLKSCEQKLDESIILLIKNIYSEKNLADLYIENLSAVKRGRYIDLNISIKNSGTMDAKNSSFSILDDNSELIETRDLGDITPGSGVTFQIKNLRLARDLTSAKIMLDYYDNIDEIDEKNNKADMKFE